MIANKGQFTNTHRVQTDYMLNQEENVFSVNPS